MAFKYIIKAYLKAKKFPAVFTDLATGLTHMDRDTFTHVELK